CSPVRGDARELRVVGAELFRALFPEGAPRIVGPADKAHLGTPAQTHPRHKSLGPTDFPEPDRTGRAGMAGAPYWPVPPWVGSSRYRSGGNTVSLGRFPKHPTTTRWKD